MRAAGISFLLLFSLIVLGALGIRIFSDKRNLLHQNPEDFKSLFHNHDKIKYPVLLHHGMLPVLTMHEIAAKLREEGYAVFTTQVPAANTIAIRSNVLKEQVDILLRASGANKINLIAHSMGGVDARYLIGSMGYADKIASLVTLSSPHRGAYLAEFFMDLRTFPLLRVGADFFIGLALDGSSWWNVDIGSCLQELTRTSMSEHFNPKHPNSANVGYFSYAGRTGSDGVALDPVYFWSHSLVYAEEGVNDGIVSEASAKWGEFLGVVPVGHSAIVGRRRVIKTEFNYNPKEFFRSILDNLRIRGF